MKKKLELLISENDWKDKRIIMYRVIYTVLKFQESSLDKTFKLNTKSLEIKLLRHKRKKFTIHFIEENVVKLKQEIIMLIDRNTTQFETNEENLNEKTSAE